MEDNFVAVFLSGFEVFKAYVIRRAEPGSPEWVSVGYFMTGGGDVNP